MARDAQLTQELQVLLRLVTGSAQDGQTHPQVPDAALSHASDQTLQATVTTQEVALGAP